MPALDTQVLGAFKTGMDRSSNRGGKDGAKRLYTLQNAYLNERGDALPRPGLAHVANVANSAGLYGWKGQLHVFHGAASGYTDPANPLVTDHTLPYPLANAPADHALTTVHFVGAILGELYVVAGYADATVRHAWLQEPEAWQASHVYSLGTLIQPTVPNGYFYQAPTSSNVPAWQPGTVYAVGDQVQPITPNSFIYQVVDVTGTPTSGDTEPDWPTEEGAQVFEGTEEASVPSTSGLPTGGTQPIKQAILDRYDLLGAAKDEVNP